MECIPKKRKMNAERRKNDTNTLKRKNSELEAKVAKLEAENVRMRKLLKLHEVSMEGPEAPPEQRAAPIDQVPARGGAQPSGTEEMQRLAWLQSELNRRQVSHERQRRLQTHGSTDL